MIFKIVNWTLCVFVFAFLPVAASAQYIEEAKADMEAMAAEINEFVGDVRFDESDIQSLIELWDEFDQIGEAYEDDDDDETINFSEVLADPDYRALASSNGLDPDVWLRKATRIMMVMYREVILEGAAAMPQQMQEQLEMLEQQREQYGEEVYQQMKEAMENSAELTNAMVESAKKFPKATAAEAKLLEGYKDQLTALMSERDDDEDEWGYDDDYDDEYEDEYDDEYDEEEGDW
jgi:DNA repair ATPase RecN